MPKFRQMTSTDTSTADAKIVNPASLAEYFANKFMEFCQSKIFKPFFVDKETMDA